jgi:hypothetical protein
LLIVVVGALGVLMLPRLGRQALKLVVIAALAYGVIVIPWWIRNSIVFGTMQPVPLSTVAASWEYADWYNYTNHPTLAAMFSASWQANLNLRWDAVLKDFGVILTITFPLGLIGLPVVLFRREPIYRLFTLYALALFFGISLILPSSGPGGALYHSAGSFIIWSAWGSTILVKRLFEKMRTRLFAVALYGVLLGLGLGQSALTWPVAVEQSQIQGQQFAQITDWLHANVPPGEPVLTTQANSLNYASGYPAISIPIKQGVNVLLQVAEQYAVRYVIVTEKNGLYPAALNDPYAGFELIASLPDTLIYRLTRP